MAKRNELDLLVQHACFAADGVRWGARSQWTTEADLVRLQLKRALEMLIGNGLIQVVPAQDWPEYVVLDPPYKMELL